MRFSTKELAGIVFFLNSATASQTSWKRPRSCGRKTRSSCQRRGSQSSRVEHPRHPTQQLGRALEFSPKQAQVLIELVRKSQELSLPRKGFVAERWRDNVVNYGCRDRADLPWQYTDCARLVDESGKKGWPKLDGPQRGQVHPGLIWPDAVGARPSPGARTRPLAFLGCRRAAGPCRSQSRWDGKMGVKWPKKGAKWGMVQNACHSGDSSGPLDGSGVLQRLLPAAERRNFIAWRREPQGRCRRERTTNPLDPNPKRGRQLNASRTWGRL